jgi:hypothetical protein
VPIYDTTASEAILNEGEGPTTTANKAPDKNPFTLVHNGGADNKTTYKGTRSRRPARSAQIKQIDLMNEAILPGSYGHSGLDAPGLNDLFKPKHNQHSGPQPPRQQDEESIIAVPGLCHSSLRPHLVAPPPTSTEGARTTTPGTTHTMHSILNNIMLRKLGDNSTNSLGHDNCPSTYCQAILEDQLQEPPLNDGTSLDHPSYVKEELQRHRQQEAGSSAFQDTGPQGARPKGNSLTAKQPPSVTNTQRRKTVTKPTTQEQGRHPHHQHSTPRPAKAENPYGQMWDTW